MVTRLFAILFIFFWSIGKSQCPQVYNYLGALSSNPLYVNCTGSDYALNFQSNTSWGTYTINWGDGSPDHTAAAYVANSVITHTYAAPTASYVITLLIPALSCTLTGNVFQEQSAQASISPGFNVNSNFCAPKTLTFTNATTFTSTTTSYTWSFGDTSPPEIYTYTNSGQDVTHTYPRNSVNCATSVTLSAQNYCNFVPSTSVFGPLQVFDVDDALIAPDRAIRCWPDNQFTFTNASNRKCLAQGNTFQRQEKWRFLNYKGPGIDSIIDWQPWPPSLPRIVSYPAIGFYQVMLIDSSLCGLDTVVIGVSITSPPNASVLAPAGPICQNASITFTNASTPGAFSYRWNFGTGGGFVNLGTGNKNFTYTTPGTYTVLLVSFVNGGGNACSDTASVTIDVLPSPIAAFSLNPGAGCDTMSVLFTDLSTGAGLWNWDFGNGGTSTLSAPPPQFYATTNTFTITLAVTATTGCVHLTTHTLIVRPKPNPDFTAFVTCVGVGTTFTNTSAPLTGVNAITGYTWNFGDQSAHATATVPAHTYTAQGTYSVTLVANSAFCTDSVVKTILVNVKPTASFSIQPTNAGCPLFAASFSNTSANATGYKWDFGTSLTNTSALVSPSFTFDNILQVNQVYTVTLYALTGAGCADTITGQITVFPKPIANFATNVITGCAPLITTFSNTSTGATTFSYTFGDGASSTQPNPSHTYTNTSLFTQTVTAVLSVTNSTGCADTISKLITIYPEALTVFTMVPTSGCSPLNVNFQSVPGVAIYSWNHGDGTPTYTTNVSHNWTYTNTGTSNLTFNITLNAQTTNGCLGSGTGSVIVFANPVASFTNDATAGCSRFPVSFTNTSIGYATGNWTFGNGLTSTLNTASTTYTNAPGNSAQLYTIKLAVQSTDGCRDSTTKQVTVHPQPASVFDLDTAGCSPATIRFYNDSKGASSYFWDFGDGSSSTKDSVQHLYNNTTGLHKTYTVKLVATSGNNCKDSSNHALVIHPKPSYDISATPVEGCSPLKVLFHDINGAVEYQWKYDNISFSNAGNVTNTFENKTTVAKTYQIELVARDVFKCADTATTTIKVFPIPTAKFSAKPLSMYLPAEPVIFTNESTKSAQYGWSFGDGETSTAISPSHTYTKPGEYQTELIVTNNFGCADTFALPEKIVVLQESAIEMPNAFTPSLAGPGNLKYDPNDLSNDIFHPNIQGTEKYQFSIFSRWGELLFETKNPEEGWDGYYKGKLCTQDIYIWKVEATFLDGKSVNKTGDLLLLR